MSVEHVSAVPAATYAPSSPAKRYLFTIIGLMLLFFGAVALANYRLNPFAYSPQYVREVAQALGEGQNYATYDPNINWRALRREEIKRMTTTPDVVVFGGSRWQEAYAELLPSKLMYNAHGHSDYAEDFFAVTQLLEENGRLPDTMVLSLRYIIFEPVEVRVPTDWREWVPEYRRMAYQLDIEPHPYLETLPTSNWAALFSVPALIDRITLVNAQTETPGPTPDLTTDTLDVIGADGSLRWSRRNIARFTPEFAQKDALSKLKSNLNVTPAIDPQLVAATEKLIEHLRSKGVKVVFAQTPFHPAFYDGIEARPFGQRLHELEALTKTWEQRYGILSVGSFNPHAVGCTTDQFIDWHHAKPSCLAGILKQIPWLN